MIILIIGPMCSGKTSKMINLISKYKYKNLLNKNSPRNYIVFKKNIDNRFNNKNEIVTHDRDISIKINAVVVNNVNDIYQMGFKYDIIGIDELHFYDKIKIMPIIKKFHNLNKIIIITFLNGDYTQKPFNTIDPEIYSIATNIIFNVSTCYKCNNIAYYSTNCIPMIGSKIISDGGFLFKPSCKKHLTNNSSSIICCIYGNNLFGIKTAIKIFKQKYKIYDITYNFLHDQTIIYENYIKSQKQIFLISGEHIHNDDLHYFNYKADKFISIKIINNNNEYDDIYNNDLIPNYTINNFDKISIICNKICLID